MSTRSAARTSSCSTAPPSGSTPTARSPSSLPAFREQVTTVRCERAGDGWRCVDGPVAKLEEGDEDDYCACMLGLRDYVDKNGFAGVVLGLSGGIDSALVRGARGRCARARSACAA